MPTAHFQGLRTAIYYVTDMQKAKDWYTKILGIEPYFVEPFYIGFNIDRYELGLHPASSNPNEPGQPISVYWGVDDVEATYARLLADGATAFEEPHDVGGNIIVAAVRDPWGNKLGVIYLPLNSHS